MKTEERRGLAAGHDLTRWKLRPFVWLVAGFFIFMGVMFVVLAGLTKSWTHGTSTPASPPAGPQSNPDWNTSAPQLQTDALADLHHLQRQEYERLHATKWTDDTHAYATIPIEKAMDLIATAEAEHRLDQILPPPKPATPLELQNQKITEAPNSP
jgi:hypothetical protein